MHHGHVHSYWGGVQGRWVGGRLLMFNLRCFSAMTSLESLGSVVVESRLTVKRMRNVFVARQHFGDWEQYVNICDVYL